MTTGGTSGPFVLVVDDARPQPARQVGVVAFEGEAPEFVVDGLSVAHWLGALTVLGLGDQRIVAQVGPPAGDAPTLTLRVGEFFCDVGDGVCRIQLELAASGAVVPAWLWTEEFPFAPTSRQVAQVIVDALGRSVRLGVSRAALPEVMQPPAVAAPVVAEAEAEEEAPVHRTGEFLPDMTLRGLPINEDCYDAAAGRPSRVRQLESLEVAMGSDPQRTWKTLRDYGAGGARVIGDWLADGAPNATLGHVEDAADWVLQCGQGDDWFGAMTYFKWETDARRILRAVRGRAPLFNAARVKWFVETTTGKDRVEAAIAMVGGHKQRHVSLTPFGVMYRASDVVEVQGAQAPPHHVAAVTEMLDGSRDEPLWRAVIRSIGIYFSFDVMGQEAWGAVLLKALREAPKEWDGVLQDAALQMARGLPKELDEAVNLVFERGIVDMHTIMVAGFEDRLERQGAHEAMRGPLTRFAAEGLGLSLLEARMLLQRLNRQLKQSEAIR